MRRMTFLILITMISLAGLGTGCDAVFRDLRPKDQDMQEAQNMTPRPDLTSPPDLTMAVDLTGADLDPSPDFSPLAMPDLTPTEVTLASGTFEGRHGYFGEGGARLVQRSDGRVELRFGSDFRASPVPGPVVYLSSRDMLGDTVNTSTDLRLGTLRSPTGVQSYLVPVGGEVGRLYAWVYCEPFRVEVARATMQ